MAHNGCPSFVVTENQANTFFALSNETNCLAFFDAVNFGRQRKMKSISASMRSPRASLCVSFIECDDQKRENTRNEIFINLNEIQKLINGPKATPAKRNRPFQSRKSIEETRKDFRLAFLVVCCKERKKN